MGRGGTGWGLAAFKNKQRPEGAKLSPAKWSGPIMKSASPNLLASASQNGDDISMRSDPAANHDPSNLERLCKAVEQRDSFATEAFALAFLLRSTEASSL